MDTNAFFTHRTDTARFEPHWWTGTPPVDPALITYAFAGTVGADALASESELAKHVITERISVV